MYVSTTSSGTAAKEGSAKTNLCAHRPFLHRVALKSDVFHDLVALYVQCTLSLDKAEYAGVLQKPQIQINRSQNATEKTS